MPKKTSDQENLQPPQGDFRLLPLKKKTPRVQTTAKPTTAQLHRYTERLQVLHDVHSAILTAQSPKVVAQASLARLRTLIPCFRASVSLFDWETQEEDLVAVDCDEQVPAVTVQKNNRISFALHPHLDLAAFRQGQVVVEEDLLALADPPLLFQEIRTRVRSYLSTPLIVQGTLIGALHLAAIPPRAFSLEHRDIAQEVASSLAIALQQARLNEAARQHAEHLEQQVAERTAALQERQHLEEAALRRSEERFRGLIEHSTDVFMILGPDGSIHYRSPTITGRGLHEYQIEELIGRNAGDLVHPEDRPRMQAFLAGTVQRPGPSPLAHFRARHSDGSWRVMEAILNNQLTNPAIAGIIYTGRDVTERKQAEEALRTLNETLEQRVVERTHALQDSEERYRDLFDNASDMIATLTLDEVLTNINRALRQHLGYTREEVIGHSWQQFTTPASAALVNERARRVAAGEHVPAVFEVDLIHKDGRVVPIEARARIIRNPAGVPTGIHSISRDITQRKEVDRLKDELISTVSHELRTPLASMRGFSELLLTRDFPPQQQREMVAIIHQESTRLSTLINDFLDLQRMAKGRAPDTFEPVDIEPLLREAIALFSAEQEQRPFQCEVQAPLPLVSVDLNRMRQVLRNLLSNAIKYSPASGAVTIGARLAGEEVLVWVTDHGIGIPPEALPHLFAKFFRVDNAATRQIGGTGLGLALVKEIVTAHHGRVWIDSTLDTGSTFFFTIPLASGVSSVASTV